MPLSPLPGGVPDTVAAVIDWLDGHAAHAPTSFSGVRDTEAALQWVERITSGLVAAAAPEAAADARFDLLEDLYENQEFRAMFPAGFFDDLPDREEVASSLPTSADYLRAVCTKLEGGAKARLALHTAVIDEIAAFTASMLNVKTFSQVQTPDDARDWVRQVFSAHEERVLAARKETRS